jgi:quercetin dioxygenase-like cupin family protein
MSARFITSQDIKRESFEWGESGWVARPSLTGSTGLCVMDVTLSLGQGHALHRHPEQEEIVWVSEGRIEQWLEEDKQELCLGEAVYIPTDVVHASFTVGEEDAKLSVILTPTAGDDGYSVATKFVVRS